MEGKESLVELFEKEVKTVEGLGLAGVGSERVEEGKGIGKGRRGSGNAEWGSHRPDRVRKRTATAVEQNVRKSRRVGRSQGALVPFITLE